MSGVAVFLFVFLVDIALKAKELFGSFKSVPREVYSRAIVSG